MGMNYALERNGRRYRRFGTKGKEERGGEAISLNGNFNYVLYALYSPNIPAFRLSFFFDRIFIA